MQTKQKRTQKQSGTHIYQKRKPLSCLLTFGKKLKLVLIGKMADNRPISIIGRLSVYLYLHCIVQNITQRMKKLIAAMSQHSTRCHYQCHKWIQQKP